MTGRKHALCTHIGKHQKYQTSYYTKAQKEILTLSDFQFHLETVNYVCTIIFQQVSPLLQTHNPLL